MDEDDNRSVSFLHLLSILKAAEDPPDIFFLENVRGFEGSHAHQRLLEVSDHSKISCMTSLKTILDETLALPYHINSTDCFRLSPIVTRT